MAPAKKGSGTSSKRKAAEDDDLLVDNQGSLLDSFIVLSAIGWSVGKAISFFGRLAGARETEGEETPTTKKSKKDAKEADEEKLPLKEAVLEFANKYKIPVGLTLIFTFTCMVIALGETVDTYADLRKTEPADDYYSVLGIARDAETGDIKRAYKTLAKRWHPDKNPNCTVCSERFAKIGVAYEALSNAETRAAYDDSGDIATTELKSPRSVPLTQENFDELVTYSNDVWIVQIFKPSDGASSQFHPFWENQIAKHGHLVRFGRIDATNDPAKWLPVRVRYLPMILKFGRHLSTPEIFPITMMHEYHTQLMKFVLTSFPNIGLPVHSDVSTLTKWLRSASRTHKVLFAIPGRSEEERYKSHLLPRKLASRWSEVFEIRTVETAVLHDSGAVPDEVKAALPPKDRSSDKGAVILFPASGGATPKAAAVIPWPTGEDELVTQLLEFSRLAPPALSAQSAELLCHSLAVRRVYCLVLLDPSGDATKRALEELADSKTSYAKEVAEIRAGGGDVGEEEDNFVVFPVRLFRQRKGLQPSIATCKAPAFSKLQGAFAGATSALLDFDQGRIAALQGTTSFRGLYPQIAYEDSLAWVDDALHPYLSLPDCNEGIFKHMFREMKTAPVWKLAVQLLVMMFLAEAFAKAATTGSLKWLAGALVLLILTLLRSPPFLRKALAYIPAAVLPALTRTEL
eukprot:TRINITY_DN49920_c0_g1_i1.p1 TRINITY_DN49920_c0_g1~~TRINITY_DN49920_c0_g1_i1.p1  ORF type:complete len:687 (-),score=132.09 TRINITY_DN49920_c0_g1_i1:356-2416(-)